MKYVIRKCVSGNPHSFLFATPWLLYMPNGYTNYCFSSGEESINGLRRVLAGLSPFKQVSPEPTRQPSETHSHNEVINAE